MKKSVVVLFVLAVLFLLCSFTFITSGEYQNFICGLVIAGVLAFFGYRQYKKPASTAKDKKVEYPVYIERGGKKYHFDKNCSGMKNPKEIMKAAAKKKGYEACKKCSIYKFGGTEM